MKQFEFGNLKLIRKRIKKKIRYISSPCWTSFISIPTLGRAATGATTGGVVVFPLPAAVVTVDNLWGLPVWPRCEVGGVLWGLSSPATAFEPCNGELPGVDAWECDACVWHPVLGERRAWCLVLEKKKFVQSLFHNSFRRKEKW